MAPLAPLSIGPVHYALHILDASGLTAMEWRRKEIDSEGWNNQQFPM